MSEAWEDLRKFTQARIGLARAGHATSTSELLKFQRAHAEARDAVWREWKPERLAKQLRELGHASLLVSTGVRDRAEFLKRPDLGRRLKAPEQNVARTELVFIVSDGLSAKAIDTHFLPFWNHFAMRLQAAGLESDSLVLAPFGRVALMDEIGATRGARLAVMFIGERPGLSSTDSLGIYLTYEPRLGRTDAERNCISNVRPPEGLSYEIAADKLIFLIRESLRLKLSGVDLKESSEKLVAPAKDQSE